MVAIMFTLRTINCFVPLFGAGKTTSIITIPKYICIHILQYCGRMLRSVMLFGDDAHDTVLYLSNVSPFLFSSEVRSPQSRVKKVPRKPRKRELQQKQGFHYFVIVHFEHSFSTILLLTTSS